MGKNLWKLTTVGLAGYIIGRERRQRPYYSQAVRYSSNYNTPYTSSGKPGIVTPILKRVEEKVSDILTKDGDIPRDVTKRIKAPRFVSKAAAHTLIDDLEEMANSYGNIRVADYLNYLKKKGFVDIKKTCIFLQVYSLISSFNFITTQRLGSSPTLSVYTNLFFDKALCIILLS